MNHIRRTATTVVSLLLALVGLTVTGTAFAQVLPPDPPSSFDEATVVGETISGSTGSGSQGLGTLAGWEVALAAVGIAVIAACLTLLVMRMAVAQRRGASVASA
jgi:hypothetical protein